VSANAMVFSQIAVAGMTRTYK